MSFKQTHNHDGPIFDQAPGAPASGFFIRRLMSLAGKPVLAEKNLPIRPSNDRLAKKCYISHACRLYRWQHIIQTCRRFRPFIAKGSVLPAGFSEKESDSNRHRLSTAVEKMRATDPNLLAILSARKPELSKKSYNKAQFENKSRPSQSYDFAMPDTHQKLLGSDTNLRSIMFTEHVKNIFRPAQFSGFKPRNDKQPADFIYPDYQAIFSSEFVIDNGDFLPHLPARDYLSLDPGNFGFLPAAKRYNYGLALSAMSTRFKIRNNHQACLFDFRPDFARNLILECKTSLPAMPGKISTRNPQKNHLPQSWAPTKRRLNQHTVTISLPPTPFVMAEPRFYPTPWMRTDCSRIFCVNPGPDSNAKINRTNFIPPFLRVALSAARCRIRLRLALKRAGFTESQPHFSQLLARHNLSVKILATKKLVASYSPFVKKKKPTALQYSPLPDISTANGYAIRRSRMKFISARHVRYCRASLTNCIADLQPTPNMPKASVKSLTRLLFPAPATIHKHREYFAASNLNYSPIKVIYLRPMAFIMRLSAMDLTDIFLPEVQRRALPAVTRFFADHSQRQARQRNRLKSLRFRLFKIDNGLCQVSLRAPRHIASPDASFKILDPAKKIRTAPPSSYRAFSTYKPYIPGYRGRLERFALNDSAPAEICRQISLNMSISGQSAMHALAQRHFISPPEWDNTEKPFKCRIKLSPHPFGFPDFRQPVEKFDLVESAISFAYLLLNKINIKVIDAFSLTRERVFLPPLSLKDPRRFLFSDSFRNNSQHNSFAKADENLIGTIKAPENINSFEHEWGMHKHRTLKSRLACRPLSSRARARQTDSFIEETSKSNYQMTTPPALQPSFSMPQIKLLLLRCEKYFATGRKPAKYSTAQISVKRPDPLFFNSLIIGNAKPFVWPTYDFFFNKPRNLKFFSESSCQQKHVSVALNFKHRPRTYRFPYQPDQRMPGVIETYKAPDEPLVDRLTFLDQIGLASCFMSFARPVVMQPANLINQIGSRKTTECRCMSNPALKHPVVKYCEAKFTLESRLDYEKARFTQQINEKIFSRLADTSRIKLRKYKRVRNQIHGYLEPGANAPTNNFYERIGSQNPTRLDFDNLHWIILLHSFIELTVSEPHYTCKSNMANAPEQAFSTVKSSFSTVFADKVNDSEVGILQPAAAIKRYAMPWPVTNHININESGFDFLRCQSPQPDITHALQAKEKFECTDSETKLTMSISTRPEYRRHIQLYIMHIAMNIDDYDLDVGVSVRPLVSSVSEVETNENDFHHPIEPDWLDLPQILEKRTNMPI